MIRLTIENSPYAFDVEFRHARGRALGRRAAIAAITTCVIVASPNPHEPWQIAFAAIGNAVCARGDNFSRREGRVKAFMKAVHQCGMLSASRVALMEAYMQHDPPPPPREPHQLTSAEKTARWEAGWEKRKAREDRRSSALRDAIAGRKSAS